MYDDYDIQPTPLRDPEASPVGKLPRLAGDEIDEERLIARLHAAIAKETGPFGLPWWQTAWARGLMVTAGLMLATFTGLQIGQRMPGGTGGSLVSDPALASLYAEWDQAYTQDPGASQWDRALDAAADVMGQHALEVEAAQPLVADTGLKMVGRSTYSDYKL